MEKIRDATISRLGVLSVLAQYEHPDLELSRETRGKYLDEAEAILDGKRGLTTEEVVLAVAERAIIGGALANVNGAGIWGVN